MCDSGILGPTCGTTAFFTVGTCSENVRYGWACWLGVLVGRVGWALQWHTGQYTGSFTTIVPPMDAVMLQIVPL